MKNKGLTVPLVILSILILPFSIFAQSEKEITKKLDATSRIKIKLVLGDCHLKKSPDIQVHVHLAYSYDDETFEYRFSEKRSTLYLEEKFHNNSPAGHSIWTIAIPDNIEVDFETATGDLTLEGVDLEIDGNTGTGAIEIKDARGVYDLNTGTGSIEIMDSEGEFEVNSGTGKIRIENSKGTFDANSGTGNVVAHDITILDEAEFNCGTGDVQVTRPKGEDYDLTLASGTDDATLDLGGSPLKGYFEFTAHARKGSIQCPVKFDKEEESMENDSKYIRKSFTRGEKSPRFYVKTGTGKATLKL